MGMIYAPTSIIQNGALINGVAYINQTTKPTTRPDGSSLMVNDRWYNTDQKIDGFWNGTYWLSLQTFGPRGSWTFVSGAADGFLSVNNGIGLVGGFFVEKLTISYAAREIGANDSANCRTLSFLFRGARNQASVPNFLSLSAAFALNGVSYPLPATEFQRIELNYNSFCKGGDLSILQASGTLIGAPPVLDASYELITRKVL
jgi:hypothetical protein